MMEAADDKVWREHQVHTEQEETEPPVCHLFETTETELLECRLKRNNNPEDNDAAPDIVVKLQGQSEIGNSTGMSVWLGAQVLSQFLIDHPCIIQGRSILELGAGLGLTGIVLAHYLRAQKVVLTDGDSTVLRQLRLNVAQHHESSKGAKEDHPSCDIVCTQLIWDHALESFCDRYGRFEVILATDCIYMTNSLKPFWKTVEMLLTKDNAMLIYVNLCASQCPWEEVLSMAQAHTFAWSSPSPSVYVFRPKRNLETVSEYSPSAGSMQV